MNLLDFLFDVYGPPTIVPAEFLQVTKAEVRELRKGEKRSNQTHESTTDPDAKLARKSGGHESKLAYCGNVMIENRNGLVVDGQLLLCSGTAERDAAMMMAEQVEGTHRITLAADKGYDTKDFVQEMRGMNVTPHVAQNDKRPGGSAIDGRTTRHSGYAVSQKKRKRIEEVFGWMKTAPDEFNR